MQRVPGSKTVKCNVKSRYCFRLSESGCQRIEKNGSRGRKAEALTLEVHKEEATLIPKKQATAPQKKSAAPKKEAAAPAKTLSRKSEPLPQKEREISAKAEVLRSRKIEAQKTTASEHVSMPSFKGVINEDDSNPPVYIKLQRVLLVPRGLTRARIRMLLLSYEKKLRGELSAQQAEYKQIVVWAYDDMDRADEGAGGWVGMVSNQPATGKLSDAPQLLIPES